MQDLPRLSFGRASLKRRTRDVEEPVFILHSIGHEVLNGDDFLFWQKVLVYDDVPIFAGFTTYKEVINFFADQCR